VNFYFLSKICVKFTYSQTEIQIIRLDTLPMVVDFFGGRYVSISISACRSFRSALTLISLRYPTYLKILLTKKRLETFDVDDYVYVFYQKELCVFLQTIKMSKNNN
jgi:hypothetical protein